MSPLKLDISSAQVDRQIELLKHFPDIADKHYRPTLDRNVQKGFSKIVGSIPFLTGEARKTFGSNVSGRGVNLTGRIGWYDKDDPWYVNVLEYGAKSHSLSAGAVSRDQRKSSEGSGKSARVFVRRAWKTMRMHPGLSRRGFMAAGFSAIRPALYTDLISANIRIIEELAAI